MATFKGPSRQKNHWFGSVLHIVLSTLALTSLLSSPNYVCASSHEGPKHFPTLKEIFGGLPKNSFPLMPRMIHPTVEFSSKRTHPFLKSLRQGKTVWNPRRGLLSAPREFLIPDTDVNAQQGGYFAEMQLGTPPQSILMLIDTGSMDFWVQSKECIVCYPELLPPYDPTKSTTYEIVRLNGSSPKWDIGYGGGNSNEGYTATDTLTIPCSDGTPIVIPDFQIGVSTNNSGYGNFTAYSGIIGLMPEAFSVLIPFLTQLETVSNGILKKFSTKFRYCFPEVSTQYQVTSFLSFGNIDESEEDALFSSTKPIYNSEFLWTPIVPNSIGFYVLNLTAISVGGVRIPFAPQQLTVEAVANLTVTIIDSGTTLNYLREPYVDTLVNAFANLTSNLAPFLAIVEGLELVVFNISQDVFDAYLFPTVSFFFQKWNEPREEIEVVLPKENVIVSLQNSGVGGPYFLNFFATPIAAANIFGNVGQRSFLIEYDLEKSRVGFLHASCTFAD